MKYGPRESLRYLAESSGIDLTDAEVEAIIVRDIERIEAKRLAAQRAGEAYERYVVELAAAAVSARK